MRVINTISLVILATLGFFALCGNAKAAEGGGSHYQQFSQMAGAVTPEKLAASPLNDNVQYLRFMVDPRLA